MKTLSAVILYDFVGILTACKLQHSYFKSCFSEYSDRTPRCFLTCLIGVIGQYYLIGVPGNKPCLLLRQSRAETGDRICKACLMQGDNVHISLGNDEVVRVAVFGKIEGKNSVAFLVDEGVRGVDILGLRVVQHTSAESNHIAPEVNYRHHRTVSEIIVIADSAVLFTFFNKVCVIKLLIGEAL